MLLPGVARRWYGPVRIGYANNPSLAFRASGSAVGGMAPTRWAIVGLLAPSFTARLRRADSTGPVAWQAETRKRVTPSCDARFSVGRKAWPKPLRCGTNRRRLIRWVRPTNTRCARLAEGKPRDQCRGTLSLLGLVAAVDMARAVVVNDSAPLHVASATNTPTVALFASTVPRFGFGPRASQHVVVEASSELPCRPCGMHGRKRCPEGHFKCGWELSVQSVLEALMRVQRA